MSIQTPDTYVGHFVRQLYFTELHYDINTRFTRHPYKCLFKSIARMPSCHSLTIFQVTDIHTTLRSTNTKAYGNVLLL